MLRRKIDRYVFEQKRTKHRPQDGTKNSEKPEVDQDMKGLIIIYDDSKIHWNVFDKLTCKP